VSGLRKTSFNRIWATPLTLAIIMVTSLVGALVAEDVWDWFFTFDLTGVLLYTIVKGYRFD
jgi:hypothetical protein